MVTESDYKTTVAFTQTIRNKNKIFFDFLGKTKIATITTRYSDNNWLRSTVDERFLIKKS